MVDSSPQHTEAVHAPLAEVCPVSMDAATRLANQIFTTLSDPESVLYQVMAARNAAMEPDAQLGISPALLVNPSKSRIVARWQLQSGAVEGEVARNPEEALALWTVTKKDVPRLSIPAGLEPAVMDIAVKLQMRGGGPDIFAREEAAQMNIHPNSVINIVGGARNANRERIRTALEIAKLHELSRPLLATADPHRLLIEDEQKSVAEFAPGAKNELDLFMASAHSLGFRLEVDEHFGGMRFLPDSSAYTTLRHEATGTQMLVLAPKRHEGKTGLYNAYTCLDSHGALLYGAGFVLQGVDMVQVTSTHYGTMSIMNNLQAVHELRVSLGSFQVAGDNQPARNARTHLIEIGLTMDMLDTVLQEPALKTLATQEQA